MASRVVIVQPSAGIDLPCHPLRNSFVHDMVSEFSLPSASGREALVSESTVVVVEHNGLASEEDLLTFHDSDYVTYLRCRELSEDAPARKITRTEALSPSLGGCGGLYLPPRAADHDFGLDKDCAPFSGMWRSAALAAGITLRAVDLLSNEEACCEYAVNWFGGRHHAHADRAGGFCFLNDVVLAAQRLQRLYKTVLIVDLDAHHGDGTQAAFYFDPNVFTFSIHAKGEYPFTGLRKECGGGPGLGACWNVPVPVGATDAVWVQKALLALDDIKARFDPQAVIVVCGADVCQGDPLGALNVSIAGLQAVCRRCTSLSARRKTLFLGAGGYVAATAARAFGCITRDLIMLAQRGELPPLASIDEALPESLRYFQAYAPCFSTAGLPPARVHRVFHDSPVSESESDLEGEG
jgi:histone deacetylase 1/2